MNPQALLLQPEAIFCLDISEYAAQIESICHDYLVPAPKGIYIKNRIDPVLVDGRTYYTKEKVEDGIRFVPITDINSVMSGVYDENRKLLIPGRFMKNKSAWISNKSLLSYRGIKIIEYYVKDQIENCLSYRKQNSNYLDGVYRQFKQPEVNAATGDYVEEQTVEEVVSKIERDVYEHLQKKIAEFVGNRNWNMYFIKIKNQFLIIERYCDWRIYDWTERMESGEWK